MAAGLFHDDVAGDSGEPGLSWRGGRGAPEEAVSL